MYNAGSRKGYESMVKHIKTTDEPKA